MIALLRKLLGAIQASTVGLVQATPKAPMSDDELAAGLTRFRGLAWNLKDATKEAWGSIPPVKVTTRFGGCAFVDAEPVQKIMHDIIQKTMEIDAARRKDDAVEKMLTY